MCRMHIRTTNLWEFGTDSFNKNERFCILNICILLKFYEVFFFFRKADNPFEFYSDIARKTSKKLPPPPYNLTIFKGHKDVALTRSSAEFFMTSKLGKGFLKWLNSGVGFPEEFFFATLSRVSQHLYNTKGLISQSEFPLFCFYLLGSYTLEFDN